jgi:hypothetical protein
MKYDHTQTGWLMVNIMGLSIFIITLAYLNRWGSQPIPGWGFMVMVALFVLVTSLFYKLRIRIDNEAIHIIYGIGLIHIRIRPERVDRVRVVRNPWYYGLGIRFTPRGMLYNIQGRDAVEIEYFRGISRRVCIGSDDSRNLKRFIERKYGVPVQNDSFSP